MHNTIYTYITKHQLIAPGTTVIVGFSGGPDSTFLLHVLASLAQDLQITLVAAHLNHGWRAEADQDEQKCKQFAEQYNVSFVSEHARNYSATIKATGSKEDQGRRLRRAFFNDIAQRYDSNTVALAHHQDDQYETFFIRLARGSGLEGLTGIQAKDGKYIRPLLAITKEEILAYLHQNNIPYLIDATNLSNDYLRNRIRNIGLPALTSCDARFPKTLQRTLANLSQTQDFLEHTIRNTFEQISSINAQAELQVNIQPFLSLHPYLQNMVIVHWLCKAQVPFTPSQGLFAEIKRFLNNPQSRQHTFYQKWMLIKEQGKASVKQL